MKKNKLLYFLYLLIAAYVFSAALLYVFQRSFIYYPTSAYGHDFEQITLENEHQNIEIIVLNRGNENAFVYFGGNAEAVVSQALEFSTAFQNKTIYMVNYRGYGGSSGEPTEAGLFSDAIAIYDRFYAEHKNLAVIGRSLGSGVAMYLAANRPVSQVVLITPYDSILALAKKQYPMLPISLLLKDKYDSISLASRVTAPILVLAGGQDKIVPLKHSKRLFDELDKDKRKMLVFEQAGHNNIFQAPDFNKNLINFLKGE